MRTISFQASPMFKNNERRPTPQDPHKLIGLPSIASVVDFWFSEYALLFELSLIVSFSSFGFSYY